MSRNVLKTEWGDKNPNYRHGMSGTKFHNIYKSMKGRCSRPCKEHEAWNGRGITVCERWSDFNNFKEDMYSAYIDHVAIHGERNTSIERVNYDGNYDPSNCKWATQQEQCNNLRTTIKFDIDGEIHTYTSAAKKFGIPRSRLITRINLGWSWEDIANIPKHQHKSETKNAINDLAIKLGNMLVDGFLTIAETAKKANLKNCTVERSVRINLQSADHELYLKVRKILDYNKSVAHLRAGQAIKIKWLKMKNERQDIIAAEKDRMDAVDALDGIVDISEVEEE